MSFFRRQWASLIVVALALGVSLSMQVPSLMDPTAMDGDARIHIAWMHRFADPGLFPNDYIQSVARAFSTPGYTAIHRTFGRLIGPITMTKLIPIGLALLLGCSAFGIGNRFCGRGVGLAVAALLILTQCHYVSGGLQRSFNLPLLTLFAYLAICRRYIGAAIVVGLASLIYPPAFLTTALASGFLLLRVGRGFRVRIRFSWKRVAPLALAILVGVTVALLPPGDSVDDEINISRYTPWEEILGSPVYGPGGRKRLFCEDAPFGLPFDPFGAGRLASGVVGNKALVLVVTAAFLLVLLRRKFVCPPIEILSMILAGALLYGVSLALLFLLYYPSRYFLGPAAREINAWVCRAYAWGIRRCGRSARQQATSRRLRRVGYVLVVLMLLAVSALSIARGSLKPAISTPPDDLLPVLEFLALQPKDVVIAGPPQLMDWVPILCKRSVYLNKETQDLTDETGRRAYRFFEAYYSDFAAQVRQFSEEEGVDLIVVDGIDFRRGRLRRGWYYEPYTSFIREIVQDQSIFALLSPPPEWIVYSDERMTVVRPG